MADSFTSSLRIIQMPTGSNDKLWGPKADAAFAMLEQGIAGQVNIDLTAGNHTLTTANNATDEARNALISLSGTPGTTRTLTMPDVEKITFILNSTDSPVILTAGAGATVALTPGQTAIVITDGATNVYGIVIGDLPGKSTLSQLFAHESL